MSFRHKQDKEIMITEDITEDYVNFETAKLLKEKGFDKYTLGYYLDDKKDKLYFDRFSDDWNSKHVGYISAPTLQMARKWLREVHKIDISVTPDRKAGYSVLIFKDKRLPFDTLDSYSTYEQAAEVAIKYCLENLI